MAVNPVLLLVEPVRRGAAHQAFNASLVLSCHAAFPDHQLVFVAFEDHLKSLQEVLSEPPWLQYVPIPAAYGLPGKSPWKSLRTSWLILDLIRLWPVQALLLTSVTPGLLWSYRAQSLFRKRPERVLAIFHAGLVEILRPRLFAGLRKWLSGWGAIMLSDKTVQFIVLESAILQQIRQRDPLLASRFKVLPHLLPPDLLTAAPPAKAHGRPVRIGFLGLATPQKGLLNFLQLARQARQEFPGDFEFELIGRLHEDYRYLKEECEQLTIGPVADRVLSRSEFVERIGALDFALFLFAGGHYDLTASGVLIDCVALGIPVIARPKPLIRQMMTEAQGPIGFICAEGQELVLLKQLQQECNPQMSQQFRLNLLKLAVKRRPDYLADTLVTLLPEVYLPAAVETSRLG